jgi:hypothetical protein
VWVIAQTGCIRTCSLIAAQHRAGRHLETAMREVPSASSNSRLFSFEVWVADAWFGASVSMETLLERYGSHAAAVDIFHENRIDIAQAVRRRLAGGAAAPIVLCPSDLI